MKVRGADFSDGTPILDIKPYLAAFDRPSVDAIIPEHWAQINQKPLLKISWKIDLYTKEESMKIGNKLNELMF